MGGLYMLRLIRKWYTVIPDDHNELRIMEEMQRLVLKPGQELQFINRFNEIIAQSGNDPGEKFKLAVLHGNLKKVCKSDKPYFMVPTMEKFDNPDDDTVPNTYSALRQRMDRELGRRRQEQNESHQLAAPPGGFWPDHGAWAATGKGKGDGQFTHVKGKGKKPLCAAAITGDCPKPGKDCVGSQNTKLINEVRAKRGLPPTNGRRRYTTSGQWIPNSTRIRSY